MNKTIYQKYCDGDKLSDKEILQGVEQFETAHNALLKLGPEFSITRARCTQVLIAFAGFAQARGLSHDTP